MTDVVDQAARVIQDSWTDEDEYGAPGDMARALGRAGLLIDPDDLADLICQRDVDAECQRGLLARAERAEAEVARLNAALDAQEPAAEKLFARVDAAEAEVADLEHRLACLLCEVAELREKWLAFTSHLGFGDNRTERAAELSEMVDPIEEAFAAQRDHHECPIICERCGDPLASKVCDECHGSGCLPNSALAHLECGTCAGAGKVHEGCVEKSYAGLAAENAELRATVERVRALADKYRQFSDFNITARDAEKQLRAALDGGEQHE